MKMYDGNGCDKATGHQPTQEKGVLTPFDVCCINRSCTSRPKKQRNAQPSAADTTLCCICIQPFLFFIISIVPLLASVKGST